MSTEKVPLWTKASPACLEREDHAVSALDGLRYLKLAASSNMKYMGDLHYFLGIEVIRTPEGILISQRHYVLSILFKFRMVDCKSISTPLDRTVKLRPDSGKVCRPTRF